ncbi:hypothetical protein [Williamsia phyllosphaerae]|uniref:DUF5666 domain-containing protein n=1 Tax=Williamsia phyllosphaerae TaxID=885042 RepID=A0ABQ1U4S5_9NOCA|nr:hypothetical protein [Williamsia phyllosphaerae]GGF10114.1 hypothetical protein GCM10007298_02590 [Williamsia phyllosphaerae]
MGHPNEPQDSDRQPTESFTRPADTADTAAPPPTARSSTWFTGSRRAGIVAGVAGLVIGGVVGGSIGWAATGNDDHGRSTSAHSRQVHSADGGQKRENRGQNGGRRQGRGVTIGTITAESGPSWTIAARNGRTVTITVGQNTRFGTAKKPQQQSDFVVGDRIAVVGKSDSGTISATRVAKRVAKTGEPGAPTTATPSATTQPG